MQYEILRPDSRLLSDVRRPNSAPRPRYTTLFKVKNAFQKYLLPGFVFQSVVVGGGYGTGRELVQFFLTKGPFGGYLGMLTATLIWGLILALGLELARMERSFDYRTFTKNLLGRGWWGFEVLYVASTILTIAVVGSASGELSSEMFGSAAPARHPRGGRCGGVFRFLGQRYHRTVFLAVVDDALRRLPSNDRDGSFPASAATSPATPPSPSPTPSGCWAAWSTPPTTWRPCRRCSLSPGTWSPDATR